jgi:hypothetical protein
MSSVINQRESSLNRTAISIERVDNRWVLALACEFN